MSDLKVDWDRLTRTSRTLTTLKNELDRLEDATGGGRDTWAHDDVADAMHEFSGNMDYNRRKLCERLQALDDKVENTLETFRQTDAELAKELDGASR